MKPSSSVDGVDAVLERDEVPPGLGDPAAEHEPLAGEGEGVVDGVLAALEVAAVVELGQVVELEQELVVVGLDLEAGPELDAGRQVHRQARHVEPADRRGFERAPGAARPPDDAATSGKVPGPPPAGPAPLLACRTPAPLPASAATVRLVAPPLGPGGRCRGELIDPRRELLDHLLELLHLGFELGLARGRPGRHRGAAASAPAPAVSAPAGTWHQSTSMPQIPARPARLGQTVIDMIQFQSMTANASSPRPAPVATARRTRDRSRSDACRAECTDEMPRMRNPPDSSRDGFPVNPVHGS